MIKEGEPTRSKVQSPSSPPPPTPFARTYLFFRTPVRILVVAEVGLHFGHPVNDDVHLEVVHSFGRDRVRRPNHHFVHVAARQNYEL